MMTPWGDRSNFASRAFAEPDVAVWPWRDKCRIAQARGSDVVDTAVRSDPGDFAAVGKREPEVAVFAHRDRERLAASEFVTKQQRGPTAVTARTR